MYIFESFVAKKCACAATAFLACLHLLVRLLGPGLVFACPASLARACVCLSGFLGLGFHLLVGLPWAGLPFGCSGGCSCGDMPPGPGKQCVFLPARIGKRSQVFEFGEWLLGRSPENVSEFFGQATKKR